MIEVRIITPAAAAHQLAGLQHLDPRGMLTDADMHRMCDHGQCFEAVGEGARAVYVLHVANGVAWCNALSGDGAGLDLCAVVDAAITQQSEGLRRVAFQTARPGLVKKMSRLGYHVTGWVMAKELTQ